MHRPWIVPLLPLVLGATAFGQDPNFIQPAYPMEYKASGYTKGRAFFLDLDRDGRLDYVRVGQTQVRTLLGTGSARFVPGDVLAFDAFEVHASAVGDWDGDGYDDVVFEKLHVSGSGLTFERMLGDGVGHLVPASPLPGPQGLTYDMRMVDVDGDADLDLLGCAVVGLRVVPNDGAGGAGAHVAYPTGNTGNREVVVGDFDLDGDVDAAVAIEDPAFVPVDVVQVMLNDGSGAFTPGVTLQFAGADPRGLHAGDLGDDGDLDLVWAVAHTLPLGAPPAIFVSENPGQGAFPPPISVLVATGGAQQFVTGDFDGDDLTDLFVNGGAMSEVHFATVGGGLIPGAAFETPPLNIYGSIVGGDLNGDLRLDLVAGRSEVATVLENAGDGTFSSPPATLFPDEPPDLLDATDRNGDGIGDLLFYDRIGSGPKALIEFGDGALGFVPGSSIALPFEGVPVAADVDLDGNLDVVVAERWSSSVVKGLCIALTDGAGGFKGVTTLPLSVPVERLGVGRVDADPFPDVVLVSGSFLSTVELRVAYGDGAGGFTLGSSVLPVPYTPGEPYVVNANGDAFGDLFYFDKGNKRVRVMHGDGAGGFTFVQSAISSEASLMDVAPLHINGDAFEDLVVFTDLERTIYLANGVGGLAPPTFSPVDLCFFERPSLVDLDGDGDEDLIASGASCDVLAWWERTGPVDFASVPRLHQSNYVLPTSANIRVHAGDFDGDGLLELVSIYGAPGTPPGVRVLTRDCQGGAGGYGHGCPGSGGFVPRLGVVGCAEPGKSVTLQIDRALGGSLSVLLIGLGEGNVPFAPGCDLLLGTVLPASFVLPLAGAGAGNGSLMGPALLPASQPDVTITLQAFVADPGAGAGGLAATAGVELQIKG